MLYIASISAHADFTPYHKSPSYLHAVLYGVWLQVSNHDDCKLSSLHSISLPLALSTTDLSRVDSSASINPVPPYQSAAFSRSTGTSSPGLHGQSNLAHHRSLHNNLAPVAALQTSPLAGNSRSEEAAESIQPRPSSVFATDILGLTYPSPLLANTAALQRANDSARY